MVCPAPLLDLIRDLLGDDTAPSAVSPALSLLGNLLPGGDLPMAPPMCNPSPPAGGACYACAAYFIPMSDQCPRCGSSSTLGVPGPDPDLHAAHRHLQLQLLDLWLGIHATGRVLPSAR